MRFLRRRAIWFAVVVSMFALASSGATLVLRDAASVDAGRARADQVVDHDAVVSARLPADRSPLDLRPDHSKLLLLAWVSVLLGAALLARTAGRTVEVRARRSRSGVSTRQRFDRGPPAATCV